MGSRNSPRANTFDALFTRNSDPWDFETSDYERAKRVATIAALNERRFTSALELGCATGVLTQQLARSCDAVIAMDVSKRALRIAKERETECETIDYRWGEIPRDWPNGMFDLTVFSEILYFLSADEIGTVSRLAMNSLLPRGMCLLVNWTGASDLPISGDDVVSAFHAAGGWDIETVQNTPLYRIDRLIQ